MLDALQTVRWDQLSHAYGKAVDVPVQLRALTSDDRDIWREAISALFGNIWHQGTIYSATPYAVPFLVELIEAPAVACKADILVLLQSIATGGSYLADRLDGKGFCSVRASPEFKDCMDEQMKSVQNARLAVLRGTSTYLQRLADPVAEVRLLASYLLAACGDRAAEIEPVLWRRLTEETDPAAKSGVLFAIAELRRSGTEAEREQAVKPVSALLQKIVHDQEESPLVRFVAALSVVAIRREDALGEALPIVDEMLEASESSFRGLPWVEGQSAAHIVSLALAPFPSVRTNWLLKLLEHSSSETRTAAIYAIFELCVSSRSAPQLVAPSLARRSGDDDDEVAVLAFQTLLKLGKARQLGAEVLKEVFEDPKPLLESLAARSNRDKFALDRLLPAPKTKKSVAKLIRILEDEGRKGHTNACTEAATALEFEGPKAIAAAPALRKALTTDDRWLPLHAARALWQITRNPSEILFVLLDELQCGSSKSLAADCLGKMGRHAKVAIPSLRRLVDSDKRTCDCGNYDDWIDEDEACCATAERAIAQIYSDIASAKDGPNCD